MTGDAVGGEARYWAFISYSHKDAAFGRRLHRELETYSLPRRLIGRATPHGPVPKRFAPIFRDRDELPAANDLTAEVRAALQQSRSLVVVCSPDAAASNWVSREVDLFRALHPDRPILAAIREGEPAQCFPEAMRRTDPVGEQMEPLAADFRPGNDGRHLGLLKLVAGIAGLGLDEVVQRDAQRRLQRVTAITAAALASVLVMGALTIFALNARKEAERQRGEAEGLVEFMLTNLRDKLKGVGRLDVMSAVNERALHYYSDQDLEKLPADSLERRARILHAMGEDDETRGDENAALTKFREARRTTATLLSEAPNDPQRILDHAQSEYWMGLVAYNRNKFATAQKALFVYKQLAERLVSMAPGNAKYRLQLGEANSDLCAVTLQGHTDTAIAAIHFCINALEQTEMAARHVPITGEIAANLIDRHAWLADAYRADGQFARAKAERLTQERILNAQIAGDPKNKDLKDTWIALQRALAKLEAQAGHRSEAQTRLSRALAAADDLAKFDPTNKQWARLRSALLKESIDLWRTEEKGTAQ